MNKRIVAVDYGKKRIGLALTDARGVVALPLTVVPAEKSLEASVRSVLVALAPYLSEIGTFVVGLPLLLDGTQGEMAHEACRFAEKLRSVTNLRVEMRDERLSSKGADRLLVESNQGRRERKKRSDETAALILLQTYLHTQNN